MSDILIGRNVMKSVTSLSRCNISCSIIIASLGGQSLHKTIDSIMAGDLKPDEVIIVLPPNIYIEIDFNKNYCTNIRILNSPKKGQVFQRIHGFKNSRGAIVIQSDDDIIFSADCIHGLFSALQEFGRNVAIGPIFYGKESKKPLPSYSSKISKRLILMLCGYSSRHESLAVITKSGHAFSPSDIRGGAVYEAEWLPGGVVACWRDDFISEDYYPYSGKAYCEDLLNSMKRTEKGVRQLILGSLTAFTDEPASLGLNEILLDHRVRSTIVRGRYWIIYYSILGLKIMKTIAVDLFRMIMFAVTWMAKP